MKKLISILVAFAMMATLCVCMAFAAPATGTKDASAQAVITKELKMPVGTTIPDATFTFEFTGEPAIADKSVTFASDTASTENGDVKTAYLWTENFADPSIYSHAGRYEYTVKEKDATYTIANENTEKMTYSKAEYKVTIDVANGDNGALYIKNVAVQQIQEDDGTASPAEDKVDPNVPGEGDTDGNTFKFANTYVKTAIEDDDTDPDPDDPDNPYVDPGKDNDGNALYVEKKVAGDLGDKTKGFQFKVKVTKPTLVESATYAAEVLDKDGKVKETMTWNSGEEKTITLADSERLVFNKLDIGASYEVYEVADTAYTSAISGTGTLDQATIKSTGLIKETQDNATVTNTSKDDTTTPTGILISNLPYIALALVAIGGLVAYVVVRRRQNDEA